MKPDLQKNTLAHQALQHEKLITAHPLGQIIDLLLSWPVFKTIQVLPLD